MTRDATQRRAVLVIGRREQVGHPAVSVARELLRDQDYAVTLCRLEDLLSLGIRNREDDLSLVVAAGGDGSVREAAALAYAADAALAILPLGTANDLARTLDIPLQAERAAELLRSGRRRRIDLGRCNGRIFCNVASIGLSAKVAQRLTRERKKRWGPLAYAREAVDALRTFRSLPVRLDLDGRTLSLRALQVGVASGETQGGGARVTPEAQIDDGRLRVYALEPQKPLRLMVMALSSKLGAHSLLDGAHFFSAERVRLETERPEKINVDGDLLERTPAQLELLPGAIEVLVPERAPQDPGGPMTEDTPSGVSSNVPNSAGLLRSDAEVALAELLEAIVAAAETHARGAERLRGTPLEKTLRACADRRRSDAENLLAAGLEEADTAVQPDPDRMAVEGLIQDVRAALSPSTVETSLRESRTVEEEVVKALTTARGHDHPGAMIRQLTELAADAAELRNRLTEAETAADSKG